MKKIMCSSNYVGCEAPGGHHAEEAAPLIHYPNSMLTLRGDSSDAAIEQDLAQARGDAAARIRYVSQSGFEALKAKVTKGLDISKPEILKLGSVDLLPEEALLVPLDFGVGGCDALEEMLRKHGPRGTAQTYVGARDRAEAMNSGEIITVRDFRSMATEADSSFKPMVMAWVVLTGMCGVLLSMAKDASRPFLFVTLPHLTIELFLWSYLLFGSEPGGSDRRRPLRLVVRLLCVVADAVVAFGPYPDGVAGPLVLAVYFSLAAVAEGLSLWLGLFFYFYRLDVNMRRLGVAMFVHGFGFHVAALEYVSPSLFEKNGTTELQNFGWVLFLAATCCGFATVIPIFKARSLNIRAQQPSGVAAVVICFATVVTVLALVFLDLGVYHSDILRTPSFLPHGPLLVACKVLSSVGSVVLVVFAVNEYTLAMPKASVPSLADLMASMRSQTPSSSLWLQSSRESRACPGSSGWCPGSSGSPSALEHDDEAAEEPVRESDTQFAAT